MNENAQSQQQQPKPTPEQIGQQAFLQVLMRQREDAQNAVAQLAAGNAVLAAEITDLKEQLSNRPTTQG